MRNRFTQLIKYLGFVIAFGILTNSTDVIAQDGPDVTRFYDTQKGYINPTSPEVWSMIKYGDAEVNLHTGTLGLNIPVYTLKNKNFTIPVSLNYASTGYKPNVQTGVLGAGWYLNAGGVITREVNGIPDESYQSYEFLDKMAGYHPTYSTRTYKMSGYCDLYYNSNLLTRYDEELLYCGAPGQEYVITYMDPESRNCIETEPDLFHYNFMGYTGSFMLQPGKVVVFDCNTPPGELYVSVDGRLSSFTITTGDGYAYSFLKTDTSQTFDFDDSDNGQEITSNWTLRTIYAPNGDQAIFEYDTNNPGLSYSCIPALYRETEYRRTKHWVHLPGDDNDYSGEDPDPDPTTLARELGISVNQVYTYFLKKITIPGEAEIEFDYGPKAIEIWDRNIISCFIYSEDPDRSRRINRIKVTNLFTNEVIKTCDLEYNYDFESIAAPKQRLTLLTSVKISGEGKYAMRYYRQNEDCAPINTLAVDWWGYFNNRSSNNIINIDNINNSSFFPRHNNGVIDQGYVARNPDFNSTVYGMLEMISYPTGGSSFFTYELNTYNKKMVRDNAHTYIPMLHDVTGSPKETGGVRIASIADHPGIDQGPSIYRDFSYKLNLTVSSGILLWEPHVWMKYSLNPSTGYDIKRTYTTTRQSFPYSKYSHVEYSNVLEKRYLSNATNSGSYTEYCFYTSKEYPDQFNPDDYRWEWSKDYSAHSQPDLSISNIRYLYSQVFSNANLRGKLKSKTFRGNMGYYQEDYTYTVFRGDTKGYITVPTSMLCQTSGQRINTGSAFLQSSAKTYFADHTERLKANTWNTYNSLGQLSKIQQSDSKGNTRIREILYAGAASGNESLSAPAAYPLKETVYLQKPDGRKCTISAVKCEYTTVYGRDDESGTPCLESLSRGEITSATQPDDISYYEEVRNDFFDTRGNVLQSTDKSGRPSCYIWGYNGAYVVARVENATLTQITPLIGHDIRTEPLPRGLDSAQKDALHAIPGALTTTYDYTPLIGISEVRDPSNRKSTFEYDKYGRLNLTKDDKDSPVNQYRYHLVNDK